MPSQDLDEMLRDYLVRQKRRDDQDLYHSVEELQRWRAAVDERLQHLNKDVERVEETGRHNLPLLLAAPRTPNVNGARRSNSILRLLENGMVKGVLKGLGVAFVLLTGWLLHHIAIIVK